MEVQPASAPNLPARRAGEAQRGQWRRGWRAPGQRSGRAMARTDRSATPRSTWPTIRLAPDAQALAGQAMERLRLSPRGYTRVLRVARTIADLAGAEIVGRVHVAEALAFRHRVPQRRG